MVSLRGVPNVQFNISFKSCCRLTQATNQSFFNLAKVLDISKKDGRDVTWNVSTTGGQGQESLISGDVY
ncbi:MULTISPECIES: hypothetical protein [Aphanizomenonaceae]|jgi:hypothetical protein|uniref:Uncharacterized protein n=1 Tax=Dolichospermum heterosporum TAC447 TaxID=747523 RepID=A0ABY5LV02_9CYAN|nr:MULTISPECIES: hypothetical protein [Aphanizomenonaceae]MBE9258544.1 hypothetical protein [Dolichospermum sp. LEGE 00246]MDK2411980.1 hypothetical protein [Aphanizomenon sp. 202]MDK2459638.1 hypothetical protein [Aphanizomenon sp. PH219]UUO15125.1 hypothetical protein NG743_24485 [Dolichospermum heterosporum TAC447]